MNKISILNKMFFLNDKTPQEIRRNISEEFRSIKRTVLMEASKPSEQNQKNRIMVTSVGKQEGKSFFSYNLARSISFEQDKQVLIVDCNVLSSSSKNDDNELGLLDYLASDSLEVKDIINHTDYDRIKKIHIGRNNEFSNELLSGKKMLELMSEFNSRYSDRIVIFDAPHLLGVNEAITISHNVDQILIVVEEGKTKVSDVTLIEKKLPKEIKSLFVLNKSLSSNFWETKH